MADVIRVQSEDFNQADEADKLRANNPSIGAMVTFCGFCRNEGGRLSALEIEHYPGMAEKHIEAIVEKAHQRWDLNGVVVIHRYGKIVSGDQIVLVITAAGHRSSAFEAANFIMDYLKTDAPFWKKEHPVKGEAKDWVAAKESDEKTKQRWSK